MSVTASQTLLHAAIANLTVKGLAVEEQRYKMLRKTRRAREQKKPAQIVVVVLMSAAEKKWVRNRTNHGEALAVNVDGACTTF